ncbi:uncharacterized protein LOC116307623 [Actinia tenebrosa]|uniref:Uncharacterized protein LOC116307623 n=1 Tax=Actinia tenebrosa TaxID=6105 RepID=A0A6P8J2D9_ACTTE|nr:uncharacterized protein LOC116307623 [Actinia tenebrosa]
MDEYRKPFECKNSPVYQAGLRLISMEKHVIPCPLKKKWLKEKGDPMAHAKRFVCSLRAWSNGTFMSGLSNCRSSEEKSNIVDELYRRVENEVAQHPEYYGIDRVQVYMVIEKQR